MDHSECGDRDLLTRLERVTEEPFAGWDFSRLQGRMTEHRPPWNYEALVRDAVHGATSLLDMETGGGEFLSALAPLPPYTAATEGYPPNIPIARGRLEPLGISVYDVHGTEPLPFPPNTFDLIINRHGSFVPAELHRVLLPGGRFMTQQVGSNNLQELSQWLGAPLEVPEWTLDQAQKQLKDACLTVVRAEEAFPPTRFRDFEAMIYYLKAVPWQIPDFSIARYFHRLEALDREFKLRGELEVKAHRFLLIAEKRFNLAHTDSGYNDRMQVRS
jgi:SAM-dependent methyltransferase